MNAKLLAAMTILSGVFAIDGCAADSSATHSKAAARGNDCVFASSPESWRMLDETHVVIWAPTRKNAYLLELMSPLHDLTFSENLAFIDGDHNGMICGYGDELAVPGTTVSIPSAIIGMRRLNDDDLKALGEQYKVQLLPKQSAKPHDKQAHNDPILIAK